MFSLNTLDTFEPNAKFYLHVKFYLAIFDHLFQYVRILTVNSGMQNTVNLDFVYLKTIASISLLHSVLINI